MDTTTPSQVVVWLKAAGESTRLRLLALCSDGALTVSDLAQALRQSEPRVSRHLRILCEAGLLARTREGQWVRYGMAEDAGAVSFVRGILLQVDRRHPLFVRDRSAARAAAALEPQASLPGTQSRLDRALSAFVETTGLGGAQRSLLMIGASHLELVAAFHAAAVPAAPRSSAVIAPSRRASQAVRSFAEARAFACRVVAAASPGELTATDLERAGGPFDAVLLCHQAGGEQQFAAQLALVQGRVAPHGRLWVFQRYESLESSHERVVEHPLARLRRLLAESQLSCERLSPIEADGVHMLAAAARRAGAAEDADPAIENSRRTESSR
jgi:DNA-binding transcriptional ArsR family regulator